MLTAPDAAQGFALAEAERPDLVISDVLMPSIDGYEFARRLRSTPELARVPVMLFTGTEPRSEGHELARRAGVARLLLKPAGPGEIEAAVSEALAGSSPAPAPLGSLLAFDREHRRMLTDEWLEKVRQLESANEALRREADERGRAEGWIRFQAHLLNAVGQAVIATEPDGTVIFWNEAAARLYGWPASEALGRKLQHLVPAELTGEHMAETMAQLRVGETRGGEFLVSRRDGHTFPVAATGSPVYNERGEMFAIVSVSRDITDRRRAEDELRKREIQLAAAQQLARIGSWEWDFSTGQITWSDELFRIFGLKAEEFGASFGAYLDRVHPDDRATLRKAVQAAVGDGRLAEQVHRILRSDGEVRTLQVTGRVVMDERGRPVRMFGASQDVTEQVEAQHRLRATTNQLQSLSKRLLEVQETERRHLARELHDEIGQVLTATKISLGSMLQSEGATPWTAPLQQGIESLDALLGQVRRLSLDLRPPLLDDLGLVPALRWYLGQLAERAGLAAHFAAPENCPRPRPTIETACFRVAQEALTNVLRHACATRVTVELYHGADAVQVCVRDDGVGFDVEAMQRRAQAGSSLGLLGMQERVALVGGSIVFRSAPGRGTEIHASFPLRTSGEEATV
jgi:PAS domain S-box-containing protein